MDFPEPATSRRQTCLSVILAGMLGMFVLFMLILITGGTIVYVLPVMGGVALLMGVHYLWWGKTMNEETAGEREEEQLRQQAERDGWPLPDPNRYGG